MYWPVASCSDVGLAASVDPARASKAGGMAEATMLDGIKPRSAFVFMYGPPCCCLAICVGAKCSNARGISHGAGVRDKQQGRSDLVNCGMCRGKRRKWNICTLSFVLRTAALETKGRLGLEWWCGRPG